MIKKIAISVVISLLLAAAGLLHYGMITRDVHYLIQCSADEGRGGWRAQRVREMCEFYLYNLRNTDNDVKELSEGAGLDYILNHEAPRKYEIAEFFLANGLDINGINHYGAPNDVTPLQASVLYNDAERVEFLIDQGASLYRKSQTLGQLNALELAKDKHKEGDSREDRSEIIKLLTNASVL
ncbi:hypothetical protein BGP75_25015 [Motiliproteus sp. MSK22-1]|nr:hypothetical protein BGP75_25015 [Motiliproteus sp. MSK22-1]